jgi:hypothetical protein
MENILLNDLLKFDDLSNIKVRFNINSNSNDFDPLMLFQSGKVGRKELLKGNFWNSDNKKWFSEDQIVIGLARIEGDNWLLFDISKITKDLNIYGGVGYEYRTLNEYEKYFGKTIIEYHRTSQAPVYWAETVFGDCVLSEIRKTVFENDEFPGYERVNISWEELIRVIGKASWKSALENQKGVYLIIDTNNGKMYVGSAYGDKMILGRWMAYANTGHGGNKELKELTFDYIKKHFKYSILDVFKSTIEDKIIIQRENWWKDVLQTRKFGYNAN